MATDPPFPVWLTKSSRRITAQRRARLASRSGDMTAAQSPRPEQSSQVFKCGAGNDSF
jgi:hypothetical protein